MGSCTEARRLPGGSESASCGSLATVRRRRSRGSIALSMLSGRGFDEGATYSEHLEVLRGARGVRFCPSSVVDDKVGNVAKSTGCDDAREFLAGSSRSSMLDFQCLRRHFLAAVPECSALVPCHLLAWQLWISSPPKRPQNIEAPDFQASPQLHASDQASAAATFSLRLLLAAHTTCCCIIQTSFN
jgi:hypothetical protein